MKILEENNNLVSELEKEKQNNEQLSNQISQLRNEMNNSNGNHDNQLISLKSENNELQEKLNTKELEIKYEFSLNFLTYNVIKKFNGKIKFVRKRNK